MSDLRNKIIRLAHQKPELRKHLIPLLKEASKNEARSVIQTIMKGLDLDSVEAQNISLWNSKDGEPEYLLDISDYVDAVKLDSRWEAFVTKQHKINFKKAYKLLSNAYSRDKIDVFVKMFPRSKFFQNAGSTKTSKYALPIVKTMKEILRQNDFEFGVLHKDFLDHWQGDHASLVTLARSIHGFRMDVNMLTPSGNYDDLMFQEVKRFLDSL